MLRGLQAIILAVSLAYPAFPAKAQSAPFQQGTDGTVSMEMENFDASIEHSGVSFAPVAPAGASGGQAVQAPGNGQPLLEYRVNFNRSGMHFVFLRGQGLSGGSNSFWLGFNGNQLQYNVSIGPLNSWQWEGGFAIDVPAPGEYTLTVTRRETDTLGDKIVILTSDVAPSGTGPAESPRGGGNALPQVTITAPADGSSFNVGDPVTFSGTASDAEDGDLTAGLSWTSSLDGSIGSGAGFSTSALSAGTHTITASTTDSGSQTGSASIAIVVQVPGGTFAGLPFTETFDDTNLRDAGATSADWNTGLSLLTFGFAEALQNTFDTSSDAIAVGTTTASDHSAALEDLDGDGDVDIVLVGNGTDRYYLNNGTSIPFSSTTTALPLQDSASGSRAVAVADFDRDGHVDLLITKNANTADNQIYYGNGTVDPFSGVTPVGLGTLSGSTGSTDVGDIDGDGDMDIVIGNTNGADEYYINLGNRIFSGGLPIPVPLDSETKAIRLGDMDRDGRLDLVVATTLDPVLFEGELRLDMATGVAEGTFLYLNNGSITPFTDVVPTRISDDENKLPSNGSMDLGDVNGDGFIDVLIGNLTLDRLYLNNASGPGNDPFFGVAGMDVSTDQRNTQSAVLVDIDNDGDLDYLAGNKPRFHGSTADNVGTDRMYLNDGSGLFSVGIDITGDTSGDSQAIAAADLDEDGLTDLLVADLAGLSRYVLNRGGASGAPGSRQLHSEARSIRVDTETNPIASVLMTAIDSVPTNTHIRYWLSNNGGATWIRAYPGVESSFTTTGSDLRWRAALESRSPAAIPSVDALSLVLTGSGTDGGSGAFQQGADGTVSMEMENFDASIEHSGVSFAPVAPAGASGSQAVQAPGNGQPLLEYRVNFNRSGMHFVFLRGQGLSGGSNSFWLGFNGNQLQYNVSIGPLNSWQWEGGFAIDVPAPGEYTLTVTRRETDTLGDKIVILTSDVAPSGTGPAESPRGP